MQGRTFSQMQKATGLSTATLAADLQVLRACWTEQAGETMRTLVQQETQRFDFILSQQYDELAKLKNPRHRLEALEAISRTAGRRCRVLGITVSPDIRKQEMEVADSFMRGVEAVSKAVMQVVKNPDLLAAIADIVEGRTVIDESGKEITG